MSMIFSTKFYSQGDYKLFRYKVLNIFLQKEPMGRGTGETFSPPNKLIYLLPNSVEEGILQAVCHHVK